MDLVQNLEHASGFQLRRIFLVYLSLAPAELPSQLLSERGETREQSFDAIPKNLHADADQQKRRETHDYAHRCRTQRARQAIREAITKKNADGDDDAADKDGKQFQQVPPVVVWHVCAKRDGDGNRAWTHRK